MPIDFAAAAARFAGAFAAQEHALRVARHAVRPALERRLLAGRQTDLATARFPALRFTDGAVTLRVPPSQRGALTRTASVPRPADAGLAFLAGLTRPLRLDGTDAVPGLIEALLAVLAALDASVSGAVPRPAVFDSTDPVAVGVLAFRALSEAGVRGGELDVFVSRIRPLAPVPGGETAPPSAPTASPAGSLDGIAEGIAAGIAAVALLPAVAESLLGVLGTVLARTLAEQRRTVLDLRGDLLDTVFARFAGLTATAARLARGTAGLLGSHLDLTVRFWVAFGTALGARIRDFVGALGHALRGVVRFLRVTLFAVTTAFDFNLLRLLPWVGDSFVTRVTRFSLDDLLDKPGTGLNRALYEDLSAVLESIRKRVRRSPLVLWPYARRQLRRARSLLDALFDTHGPGHVLLPEFPEGAPLTFRSDFPRLIDPALGPALAGAVGALGDGLRTAARGALTGTAAGLAGLADASLAARRDARGIPDLDRVGDRSAALADRVFGDEIRRQGTAPPPDGLARTFGTWLADGGFVVIGAVVDGYVAALADRAAAPLPTSPRILRRAALGRVVLPRLTLRVRTGGDLDEDLADTVAAAFAGAVRDAFRTGERRLRVLTEGVRV
ncbi:hypothetical protein ACFYXJ_25700 [Streptomyces sp. NPDC002667]|uniref:hypothetical protein n=1 Tax=Streptomyces sp. NPDC002667 TaxID=3364657 RepID=UPI00368EF9C1